MLLGLDALTGFQTLVGMSVRPFWGVAATAWTEVRPVRATAKVLSHLKDMLSECGGVMSEGMVRGIRNPSKGGGCQLI